MRSTFKHFASVLAVAGLALSATFAGIALAETILHFQKGEVKPVRILIEDENAADFTVQTAVYWIKTETNGIDWPPSPATQTMATISGHIVSGLAHATNWMEGSEYRVYFQWQIQEEDDLATHLSVVKVSCGEVYE